MSEQHLCCGAQSVGQRDTALDEVSSGQITAEQLPRQRELRKIVVVQLAAQHDSIQRGQRCEQDADLSTATSEYGHRHDQRRKSLQPFFELNGSTAPVASIS